jgi:hypothetical protein
MMNRGQAIARARRRLNDTSATQSAFWTTSDLNECADDANLEVWQAIVRNNTHMVVSSPVAWTLPPGRVSFTYAESIGVVPYQIIEISPLQYAGLYSLNNPYTYPSLQCEFFQLTAHRAQQGVRNFYYCQCSDRVEVAPVTNVARYLQITYVPQLAPMTQDSDLLLGGYAPSFQTEVVWTLAHMLNIRQSAFNPAIEREYAESQQRLLKNSTRVSQGPIIVQHTRR